MKKTVYATISFKQFAILSLVAVTAFLSVFALDLFYLNTSVSAESNDLPLIIIDAGHGGEDGGTVSSSGIVEKNINLEISLKTQALFEACGFQTLMTRSGDYLIYDSSSSTIRQKKVSDIHNRMNIITNNPNSIFLSIHQNHYEQSKYYGAQVFYSKGNSESELIAQSIQSQIVSSLQPENERQIKPSGTEIYLLHNAVTPAVMVECGFLSNAGEAEKLNDSNYQTQMAMAVFQGTLNYLNNRK